jgi:hypothetical protein
MSKDHRMTAGRYGARDVQLTRDDFASIIFTMLPVEVPSPALLSGARDVGPAPAHSSARPFKSAVSDDVLDAAREYCSALALAWPDEPIATLADSVAALLASPQPNAAADLFYAAALLCNEEAARTGATGDLTPGSAQAVCARLKSAAADAGVDVESAFAD